MNFQNNIIQNKFQNNIIQNKFQNRLKQSGIINTSFQINFLKQYSKFKHTDDIYIEITTNGGDFHIAYMIAQIIQKHIPYQVFGSSNAHHGATLSCCRSNSVSTITKRRSRAFRTY